MKLVFILNSISGGGIARVVTTYANELAKDPDLEVFLMLLHKKDHLYTVHPKVHLIENPAVRETLPKWRYIIKTYSFIRKELGRIGPDRVICNGEWINSFVYMSTRGRGYDIYLADHSHPDRNLGFPFSLFDRISYRKSKGILVLSAAASNKIEARYGHPNVVQVENPVHLLQREDVAEQQVIINMGRLSPEKGQEFLLRAFAELDRPGWSLHLLGDGPDRNRLEALTDELGIRDRVRFLGMQQDVVPYLSVASIFVLPSLTENFPMALLEAMSLPMACISSDCLALEAEQAFLKDQDNGLLVPPADVRALTTAIQKLIDDPELRQRLSQQAEKVRDQYDLARLTREYKRAIHV